MARKLQSPEEHAAKIRNRQLRKFYDSFKAKDPSSCWLWEAGVIKGTGYGRTSWIWTTTTEKRAYYIGAHQLAWCLHNGVEVEDIPMDPTSPTRRMSVCHSNSCLSKLCVNPDHLRLDTNEENARDFDKTGKRSETVKKGHITRKLSALSFCAKVL